MLRAAERKGRRISWVGVYHITVKGKKEKTPVAEKSYTSLSKERGGVEGTLYLLSI